MLESGTVVDVVEVDPWWWPGLVVDVVEAEDPAPEEPALAPAANGDRVFVWQNWTWARLHAARDGPPSYYYHFSHAPPLPADAVVAEQSLGAFHGAEIPYVFRHLAARDWPWTPYAHELSEVISSYWTRFAAAGDPNGPGAEPWPRFGAEAPVAMHFGEAVRCGAIPRAEQLAFWDAYYARRRSASRSTR